MQMIAQLAVSGYRSLRNVTVELGALNVVTGANGAGKSSLYRALRLLAEIAQGRIIPSLALDGGLESVLWAGPEALSRGMKQGVQPIEGPRRKAPISLRLGFSGEVFGYAIDLGLPVPSPLKRGENKNFVDFRRFSEESAGEPTRQSDFTPLSFPRQPCAKRGWVRATGDAAAALASHRGFPVARFLRFPGSGRAVL